MQAILAAPRRDGLVAEQLIIESMGTERAAKGERLD